MVDSFSNYRWRKNDIGFLKEVLSFLVKPHLQWQSMMDCKTSPRFNSYHNYFGDGGNLRTTAETVDGKAYAYIGGTLGSDSKVNKASLNEGRARVRVLHQIST